jgi:hypothetical protein
MHVFICFGLDQFGLLLSRAASSCPARDVTAMWQGAHAAGRLMTSQDTSGKFQSTCVASASNPWA